MHWSSAALECPPRKRSLLPNAQGGLQPSRGQQPRPAALARLLADRDGDRYETLDWDQPEQFVSGLQRLVNQVGHPTLVLAWLHDIQSGAARSRGHLITANGL